MNRQTILKPLELPRQKVAVPEWSGDVWVRGLSGAERDEYELEMLEVREATPKEGGQRIANFRARLLVRTLCNEQGEALLRPGDFEALGNQPAQLIQRLYNVASKLNGLTKADREELEKN